jgi:hypothetical protein
MLANTRYTPGCHGPQTMAAMTGGAVRPACESGKLGLENLFAFPVSGYGYVSRRISRVFLSGRRVQKYPESAVRSVFANTVRIFLCSYSLIAGSVFTKYCL